MGSLWACMLQAGSLAYAKNIMESTPDISWLRFLQEMHLQTIHKSTAGQDGINPFSYFPS